MGAPGHQPGARGAGGEGFGVSAHLPGETVREKRCWGSHLRVSAWLRGRSGKGEERVRGGMKTAARKTAMYL